MGMKNGRGLKAAESSPNDGMTSHSLGNGQKWVEAYGKDHSSVVGSGKHERIGDMGGGTKDLSHSITSGSANQKLR